MFSASHTIALIDDEIQDNDHKPATDASQNRPLAGSNSPSSHNSDVSNLQETVTEEARPDSVNTQSETHDRNERTPTQSRKRVRAVGPHFVDTGPIEREALFATPERQPSRDAAPRKRRATLARVSGVSATSGSHNSSGISPWLSQSSIGAALGVSPAQRLEGITPNPQTTIEHDIMHEKRADKTPVTLSDDDGEEEKVKVFLPKRIHVWTRTHNISSDNSSTKSEKSRFLKFKRKFLKQR